MGEGGRERNEQKYKQGRKRVKNDKSILAKAKEKVKGNDTGQEKRGKQS